MSRRPIGYPRRVSRSRVLTTHLAFLAVLLIALPGCPPPMSYQGRVVGADKACRVDVDCVLAPDLSCKCPSCRPVYREAINRWAWRRAVAGARPCKQRPRCKPCSPWPKGTRYFRAGCFRGRCITAPDTTGE